MHKGLALNFIAIQISSINLQRSRLCAGRTGGGIGGGPNKLDPRRTTMPTDLAHIAQFFAAAAIVVVAALFGGGVYLCKPNHSIAVCLLAALHHTQ